ncbi:hypothetical protein ABU162_26690 [Paenibacillus thiaminolyticus]
MKFTTQELRELEEPVKVFKDSLLKFEADTKSDSHLQIVLRAHLYVEN